MDDDDEFTPKLGRMRAKTGTKVQRYGTRVLVGARLAGRRTGIIRARFDGSRIGRGAAIGRLLSSRDRFAGLRARRAIVKTRLVRLGAKGLSGARAHLRYIQRDGVTREGTPGELYGPANDHADGRAFLERCGGDRHQFRFIVSAEDGAEYPDLKPYVRRLMTQAEHDLGTRLDWVAVDHFNTDNPHTHIMLRGVDDRGENLIIARDYVAHGLRERAAELATLDLGPRSDLEIENRLRREVGQERLTTIDRRLMRRMGDGRIVTAADGDPVRQSLAAGRLRKLGEMGLAENIGSNRWRFAEGIEDTLRRMGERGDIIRLMQRNLTARRLERPGVEQIVETELRDEVVGRMIERGLSDEHRDRHYMMIDGIDGRVHYVDIGRGDATPSVPERATVRLAPNRIAASAVDRTVHAVACANEGRYSVDLHLRHDPQASAAFAASHVRRLEAMRRAGIGPERLPDGSWAIPTDHLARSEAYARRRQHERPVAVTVLSSRSTADLVSIEAPSWLDRELISGEPSAVRDAGFGSEVRAAIAARRQWLIERQFADDDGQGFRLSQGALDALRRCELRDAGKWLGEQLGKPVALARTGERIEGIIARRVDLESGSYALVERSKDYKLVPWRDLLERNIGKTASGVMRAEGINWQFGRSGSGPAIE